MPVIPIVFYHGKGRWNPGVLSSRFKDLPDAIKPFIPDFEYNNAMVYFINNAKK
ncbi:MAG: Rpn family recombination-promoting nuclease/putative transposase [Desulfamplus sp.]|nr:Rpn family recombination-promoting nuclease/putative transposase [Desulfamplus sp.]